VLRAVLIAVLTFGAARAQTPSIQDFHTVPDIQTLTVGVLHCDVFAQHPASTQSQVACYLNGALVYNAVQTIRNLAIACLAAAPPSNLAWAFIPATAPMIGYQLGAQAITSTLPFVFGPAVSKPGNLASSGTF